ncbi:calcium uniporter protein 2, mitochondrial-like [Cucurbita pepo subsp. pepo]|uniref:calcium uniporter protein 2, mitochondrial-like n=1 Tax=Cucurbita pepo subsp. pepo TaxID=3664 RepID=UPI000C9D3995|nr:calcium uniporter protein 2, mitochondrial-like [Cucurbita pepo subsp. pepo]
MAFNKTLAHRLFNISQISSQSLTKCRISSSSPGARVPPTTNTANIAHDPGDNAVFRRFLHKRAVSKPAISPELRELAAAGNMVEKFKSLGIAPDRIRLDCLRPPACGSLALDSDRCNVKNGLTVEDARKLLKVARIEMVKWKLREIQKSWVPYSEFVRVCCQGCDDPVQGLEIARMLDESGTVIVLGNVVYLWPEQVAKAIEGLIPLPAVIPNGARRKELEEMEMQKAAIDEKAETFVRRELWCGLGFLVAQTAAFMRLTFWELTWDVMEPICFYVTSAYFIAGYTFFLKTSREPSFQGFFQSRFRSKQKRLMKVQNFDIARYNELRRVCFPNSSAQGFPSSKCMMMYDNSGKTKLESLQI